MPWEDSIRPPLARKAVVWPTKPYPLVKPKIRRLRLDGGSGPSNYSSVWWIGLEKTLEWLKKSKTKKYKIDVLGSKSWFHDFELLFEYLAFKGYLIISIRTNSQLDISIECYSFGFPSANALGIDWNRLSSISFRSKCENNLLKCWFSFKSL